MFNWSELHFFEVNSYKIHILGGSLLPIYTNTSRLSNLVLKLILSVDALVPETLPETIESGPLCITDLFQNKSVAYFQFIIIFLYFLYIFLSFILCDFSVWTLVYFKKI